MRYGSSQRASLSSGITGRILNPKKMTEADMFLKRVVLKTNLSKEAPGDYKVSYRRSLDTDVGVYDDRRSRAGPVTMDSNSHFYQKSANSIYENIPNRKTEKSTILPSKARSLGVVLRPNSANKFSRQSPVNATIRTSFAKNKSNSWYDKQQSVSFDIQESPKPPKYSRILNETTIKLENNEIKLKTTQNMQIRMQNRYQAYGESPQIQEDEEQIAPIWPKQSFPKPNNTAPGHPNLSATPLKNMKSCLLIDKQKQIQIQINKGIELLSPKRKVRSRSRQANSPLEKDKKTGQSQTFKSLGSAQKYGKAVSKRPKHLQNVLLSDFKEQRTSMQKTLSKIKQQQIQMNKNQRINALLFKDNIKKLEYSQYTNQRFLELPDKAKCSGQYQIRKAYDEARMKIVKDQSRAPAQEPKIKESLKVLHLLKREYSEQRYAYELNEKEIQQQVQYLQKSNSQQSRQLPEYYGRGKYYRKTLLGSQKSNPKIFIFNGLLVKSNRKKVISQSPNLDYFTEIKPKSKARTNRANQPQSFSKFETQNQKQKSDSYFKEIRNGISQNQNSGDLNFIRNDSSFSGSAMRWYSSSLRRQNHQKPNERAQSQPSNGEAKNYGQKAHMNIPNSVNLQELYWKKSNSEKRKFRKYESLDQQFKRPKSAVSNSKRRKQNYNNQSQNKPQIPMKPRKSQKPSNQDLQYSNQRRLITDNSQERVSLQENQISTLSIETDHTPPKGQFADQEPKSQDYAQDQDIDNLQKLIRIQSQNKSGFSKVSKKMMPKEPEKQDLTQSQGHFDSKPTFNQFIITNQTTPERAQSPKIGFLQENGQIQMDNKILQEPEEDELLQNLRNFNQDLDFDAQNRPPTWTESRKFQKKSGQQENLKSPKNRQFEGSRDKKIGKKTPMNQGHLISPEKTKQFIVPVKRIAKQSRTAKKEAVIRKDFEGYGPKPKEKFKEILENIQNQQIQSEINSIQIKDAERFGQRPQSSAEYSDSPENRQNPRSSEADKMILTIEEAKVLQKFMFLDQQDKQHIELDANEQQIIQKFLAGHSNTTAKAPIQNESKIPKAIHMTNLKSVNSPEAGKYAKAGPELMQPNEQQEQQLKLQSQLTSEPILQQYQQEQLQTFFSRDRESSEGPIQIESPELLQSSLVDGRKNEMEKSQAAQPEKQQTQHIRTSNIFDRIHKTVAYVQSFIRSTRQQDNSISAKDEGSTVNQDNGYLPGVRHGNSIQELEQSRGEFRRDSDGLQGQAALKDVGQMLQKGQSQSLISPINLMSPEQSSYSQTQLKERLGYDSTLNKLVPISQPPKPISEINEQAFKSQVNESDGSLNPFSVKQDCVIGLGNGYAAGTKPYAQDLYRSEQVLYMESNFAETREDQTEFTNSLRDFGFRRSNDTTQEEMNYGSKPFGKSDNVTLKRPQKSDFSMGRGTLRKSNADYAANGEALRIEVKVHGGRGQEKERTLPSDEGFHSSDDHVDTKKLSSFVMKHEAEDQFKIGEEEEDVESELQIVDPFEDDTCLMLRKTQNRELEQLLTRAENELYGKKAPDRFSKIGILGKGSHCIVWLALDRVTGNEVALKQIPRAKLSKPQREEATAHLKKELDFFRIAQCFQAEEKDIENFRVALQVLDQTGCKNIVKVLDKVEELGSTWITYEVGKKALAEWLYSMKLVQQDNQDIYQIKHQMFFKLLKHGKGILVKLITYLCNVLAVLQHFQIVHGNLQPDKILIEFNEYNTIIQRLRVIGFGSFVHFHELDKIQPSRIEYMSPELLQFMDAREKGDQTRNELIESSQPWSLDMWSLGTIVLEIVSGFPIWMQRSCHAILADGEEKYGTGLFGLRAHNRKEYKVRQLQLQLVGDLPATLERFASYDLASDPQFVDLLQQMLCLDPKRRISPKEVLKHPFITD